MKTKIRQLLGLFLAMVGGCGRPVCDDKESHDADGANHVRWNGWQSGYRSDGPPAGAQVRKESE